MKLSFIDIFISTIFLSLIVVGSSVFGDPGVGWHLKTGQWISENGKLPVTDIFLANSTSEIWVNDQWLADLFFWQVYSLTSWGFLQILTLVICILPYLFWLFPLVQEECDSLVKSTVVFLLVVLLASIQWFFRPVIISFGLFIYCYCLMYKELKSSALSRANYYLPVIFLLWANLHPAFVLGLVILGFANLERILSKRFSLRLFIISLLSFVATFINPWGISLYRSVLSLVRSKFFMNLNSEWLSPDLYSSFFAPFLVILLLLVCFFKTDRSKVNLFESGIFLLFLFLSLAHRRYLPFFAIASAMPLAKMRFVFLPFPQRLIEVEKDLTEKICFNPKFSLAALLIIIIGFYQLCFANLLPKSDFSKELAGNSVLSALDQEILAANDDECKIFNHPDFGGILSWHFSPKGLHYIDDRNQLLGEEPYRNFLNIVGMRGDYQGFLKKNNFCFLLLNSSDPLAKAIKIQEIPNFHLVKLDPERNMALIKYSTK